MIFITSVKKLPKSCNKCFLHEVNCRGMFCGAMKYTPDDKTLIKNPNKRADFCPLKEEA